MTVGRKHNRDRLAQLRKNGGVRRSDLRKVLGDALLRLWELDSADGQTTRAVTILHLRAVFAELSEPDRLVAEVGYNISYEVAGERTGERLEALAQLKGKGYSLSRTQKLLSGVIAGEVETRLDRRLPRPPQEAIDAVIGRERAQASPDWAGASDDASDAERLHSAMSSLFDPPEIRAQRMVQTFLASRVYAARPESVGYPVRVTDNGAFLCVFTEIEPLRRYQRAHYPNWKGAVLEMTGMDLINEVATKLPGDVTILVNPSADDRCDFQRFFLPPGLIEHLYHAQ
jgi:hypothetical protein